MISQIAEAISAFFYSMDVIDEEEKGKSRYGIEIIIEQNRCAMACQGCDAVFLFLNKKQWKPSPNSSIVKSPQPTIKQDRHYHCL